ncbi:hypothetical protein C5S32_02750 [ANME-1 cluster archaeon GoMg1]|nr:hypothetical protein [ANME-1 cluster archaeon GoMg1]
MTSRRILHRIIVRLNISAFEFCKKYGIKNYIEPPSFAQPRKENFDVANHLLLIAFFQRIQISKSAFRVGLS